MHLKTVVPSSQHRSACHRRHSQPPPTRVKRLIATTSAMAGRFARKAAAAAPMASISPEQVEGLRHEAITADTKENLVRKVFDTIPSTARFVCIGEASHGTEDFYRFRAEVTKLLIEERGFMVSGVRRAEMAACSFGRVAAGGGGLLRRCQCGSVPSYCARINLAV